MSTDSAHEAEPFKVWPYQRPVGHSRSSAVQRGIAPMKIEWAYALLSDDGSHYETSGAVSGFASEAEARAAAEAAIGGTHR
jgi:hypothetical protein